MTPSQQLAAHFTRLRLDDVPEGLVSDAKTLIRDYLGVALGGSVTDSGKIAARFAAEVGGKPESTLIGHSGRVPAMQAAFVNAITSHSIELDDVDVLALFHFSPPVVSAALAVAEASKSSGSDLLLAVVAGCEMMARASAATNNSLRNRGFHTTPTCGVFGAAVAAGLLLKLSEEQMVSALGLAGAQSGGLMEMYDPSMQKRFNPGPAARSGVTAAMMAQLGFTGTDAIFDGERGFCRAFSDDFDLGRLTERLGTEFPVHMEFKPYSCARPIHNAIDCALTIRSEMREPLSDVTAITMRRHPDWANYHLNARPSTYHEAQVSLPYSVAVALIEGAALFPQYQNSKLKDPEIIRLSDLVHVVPDHSLPRGVSCRMELTTAAGATYSAQVDHPKGSIENPMSDAGAVAKMHTLGDPVVGAAAVDRIAALVAGLDRASDIQQLLGATVPEERMSKSA